jgi:hypothetical protein
MARHLVVGVSIRVWVHAPKGMACIAARRKAQG